jgi:hypothetical protein
MVLVEKNVNYGICGILQSLFVFHPTEQQVKAKKNVY